MDSTYNLVSSPKNGYVNVQLLEAGKRSQLRRFDGQCSSRYSCCAQPENEDFRSALLSVVVVRDNVLHVQCVVDVGQRSPVVLAHSSGSLP